MTRHFVTLFDHRYLAKGLAMHQSLTAHSAHFLLWVVALSSQCESELRARALPHLVVVPLRDVEELVPELATARRNRTLVEYFYTLSPAVCRYVVGRIDDGDLVTYLDADLYFFGSPEHVFSYLENKSIGITPHRFSAATLRPRYVGEFNVGWVSFRKDAAGQKCLEWWLERCVEWCYERSEDGKYADQGYLDRFPRLFEGVAILNGAGINAAPWNLAGRQIRADRGTVTIDGEPLVFFHFAEFKQLSRWHYSTNTAGGGIWLTRNLRRALYYPYIRTLQSLAPEGLPRGAKTMDVSALLSFRGCRRLVRIIFNVTRWQYIFRVGRRLF